MVKFILSEKSMYYGMTEPFTQRRKYENERKTASPRSSLANVKQHLIDALKQSPAQTRYVVF